MVNCNQEDTAVDVGKILSRKADDYPLEPNDILLVPHWQLRFEDRV